MERGSLVVRKARWGINSKILGTIISIEQNEVIVLWSTTCELKHHLIDALQEVTESSIEEIKQRICTST